MNNNNNNYNNKKDKNQNTSQFWEAILVNPGGLNFQKNMYMDGINQYRVWYRHVEKKSTT